MVIADFLEVMRQSFGMDPYGMQATFLLIAVNRDDDAYNLIKYWAGSILVKKAKSFKETYKGDWIYLTGEDKTEDFYNVFARSEKMSDFSWHYRLSLVALKMKTINDMEDKVALSWPVMDCIRYVLGYKKSNYETVLRQQEQHLQTYLKEITHIQVLEDLLDPDVLTKFMVNGQDPQYDDKIKCAFWLFNQIPGALAKIEQFLSHLVICPSCVKLRPD
jgi:hypothetical protein